MSNNDKLNDFEKDIIRVMYRNYFPMTTNSVAEFIRLRWATTKKYMVHLVGLKVIYCKDNKYHLTEETSEALKVPDKEKPQLSINILLSDKKDLSLLWGCLNAMESHVVNKSAENCMKMRERFDDFKQWHEESIDEFNRLNTMKKQIESKMRE